MSGKLDRVGARLRCVQAAEGQHLYERGRITDVVLALDWAAAGKHLPSALVELDAAEATIEAQRVLLERALGFLTDIAGGGLGIRTKPEQMCWWCQNTVGLNLHEAHCDLARFLAIQPAPTPEHHEPDDNCGPLGSGGMPAGGGG